MLMKALPTPFSGNLKICFLAIFFVISTSALASIEITNQTCICYGDGTIELSTDPDPGFDSAGPFTFEWSGPNGYTSDAQSPDDLKDPGMYFVTVTNAFGCVTELSTQVEPCIIVELESVACFCSGGFGKIDVNVSMPGVDPNDIDFEFYWSISGDVSEIQDPFVEDPIVFFEDATYTLVVYEDNYGCTATFDVFVPECNFDLNSYTSIIPDCNEEGTSSISLQIPPGMGLPPYQVTWIKLGGGIVEVNESQDGTATVNNLTPGEYCLTVLTTNGCEEHTCGLIIEEALPPTITPTVTPVNIGNDGAISLAISGGAGPFHYTWSNGITGPAATTINNLSTGLYSVTVSYGDGKCEKELSFYLNNCSNLFQQLNNGISAVVHPMTGSGNNASIDLNVTEDYPGYNFSFSWTNGETTEDIVGLAPGDYCVDISSDDCPDDTAGPHCFKICNYTVKITSSPINCHVTNLTAYTQPSNIPYKYNWSTGLTTPSTPALFGTEYCVTITAQDGSSCQSVVCTTPEQEPLAIDADVTSSTNGNNDGAVTITVTGGVSPYQYLWDDGSSGPERVNLGPGVYSVTVTDACGNLATLDVIIQCEFHPDDVVAVVSDVACYAGELGSIDIIQLPQVEDVQNPVFYFQWSNGAVTQNIDNLTAGQYCVTITEAISGCYAVECYRLQTDGTEAFQIGFQASPSCWPTTDGTITANVAGGGEAPFDYTWSAWQISGPPPNFGNTPTITGLSSGWYAVSIKDSWGCLTDDRVFLNVPKPPFSIDLVATPNPQCSVEVSTGEVVITSGNPTSLPLTYDWQLSSPPTSYNNHGSTLSGMAPGNWGVTVTDANGCEVYDWAGIEQSDIQLNSIVNGNGCEGSLGSISLYPSGGIHPYTFEWSNGATAPFTFFITGTNGTYDVTVTDNIGCSISESFVIEPTPSPSVELSIVHPSTGNGQITTQVSGGSPPYSYSWNNGSTEPNLYGINGGFYVVSVTDNNGCIGVSYTNLFGNYYPMDLDISAEPCFTSNNVNLFEGEITVLASGGCPPYTYTWTGPNGELLSSSSTLSGINEPGEYCITVEETCGSEMSECISMFCDCNEAPIVRFYVSNPCLYGGIWDDGTADITIDDITNIPSGSTPSTFYIEYFEGSTLIGYGEIVGNSDGWVLVSGTNHVEVGAGFSYVRVTHESGCSLTYTYEFHEPFGCDYNFLTTSLQSEFDNEGLSSERIIFRCQSISNPCGDFTGGHNGWGGLLLETLFGGLFFNESDSEWGTLKFFPCDKDNPCNSGGFLKCSVQCDQSSYWVPPNIDGQLIYVDDNECGCLFPENTIPFFINDNLPVFGKLSDCTNPTTHSACDGSDPVINTPSIPPVECPPDCAECVSLPSEFDECTMDVFCVDDSGNNTFVDSYSGFYLCRTGENDPFYPGANIYLGCSFNDPCVLSYMGTMSYEEGFFLVDGLFFNWLDQLELGVENPEDLVNCETVDESTSELLGSIFTGNVCSVNDIPLCPCTVLNPFTGGDENTFNLVGDKGNNTNSLRMDKSEPLVEFGSKLFPNPFMDGFTISIMLTDNSKVTILVFDGIGKKLKEAGYHGQKGINTYEMKFENQLAKNGLYNVLVMDEYGNREIQKIVRVK